MSYGVTVAHRFLVPTVKVRILVRQQTGMRIPLVFYHRLKQLIGF